jgi:acetylornithine deacetylase/succinyl-diaminopimelate desuccinylase-like protein
MKIPLATVVVLCLSREAPAQQNAADVGARLLREPAIQAALLAAKRNEPQVVDEQVRICEIEAPPFKEEKRGLAMKAVFERLGLRNVRIDEVGNVLGERPGRSARPHFVMAAHLDTVFPEGTDVRVKREGAVLKGPGIGDDCRGLAVLIGVIRALADGRVATEGSITFVANVGEEGLGDLRGVKHLFDKGGKGRIDRFVSVDGLGYGITDVGVGSYRYRVTFKGPGGHSYGAFGMANPIHALGRALAAVSDFEVPKAPKTTFNVGRIGGGTSVNSIPFEAWAEVDMRSHDKESLEAVDRRFHEAVDQALQRENARWGGRGALSVQKERVGTRPPGLTPRESEVVQAAISVTRALGLDVSLDPGSTDSNVPMWLGVPAVTIDGGGSGGGAHSLGESFDSTDSWKGTQRALLLAVALTQP